MEFSRALYFVIISSTTVGFGDVVCVSRAGKLVVMIGSLSSVLLFSALFANVAERLLVGRWHLIAMFLVVGVAVLCEVENASLEDMVWLLFQTITTVGSETKRKPLSFLIPNKKQIRGHCSENPSREIHHFHSGIDGPGDAIDDCNKNAVVDDEMKTRRGV